MAKKVETQEQQQKKVININKESANRNVSYSTAVQISSSSSQREVVIDFLNILPIPNNEDPSKREDEATVASRIVMPTDCFENFIHTILVQFGNEFGFKKEAPKTELKVEK